MEKLINPDEIKAYFEILLNQPNGKFTLAHHYGVLVEQEELRKKKRILEEKLNLMNGERTNVISFLGEDIAIAEIINFKDKPEATTTYHPVLYGRPCFQIGNTFDEAVLIAFSFKYGLQNGIEALSRLLELDKYEKGKALANKPKTFVDKVLAGEAELSDIDDYAAEWHTQADNEGAATLHGHLGLTFFEYKLWIEAHHNSEEMLGNIIESIRARSSR